MKDLPPYQAAYSAWDQWCDREKLPLLSRVLHAAVLASSSHNSQPWKFAVRNDSIYVLADTERNLGALDARRRDLFVSIGCAIENIVIAAAEAGHRADISLTLDRFDRPLSSVVEIAHITLTPDTLSSPLADLIGRRHTERRPFDAGQHIVPDLVDRMARYLDDPTVGLLLPPDKAGWAVIGDAIARATDIILSRPNMVRASDRWIRTRRSVIEKSRDGITLEASGAPEALINAMDQLFRLSPQENHASWPAMTRAGISGAPHLGVLLVRDPLRVADAIACGRLWQRLHLVWAQQDIAAQAFSQIGQVLDQGLGYDFVELDELAAAHCGEGWWPMLAFRLGRSIKPPPKRSPRRSVDEATEGAFG